MCVHRLYFTLEAHGSKIFDAMHVDSALVISNRLSVCLYASFKLALWLRRPAAAASLGIVSTNI